MIITVLHNLIDTQSYQIQDSCSAPPSTAQILPHLLLWARGGGGGGGTGTGSSGTGPSFLLAKIITETALPFPSSDDRGRGIDPRPLHFQQATWSLDVTRQTRQPRPSGVLPKPWHAAQDLISGVAPRP
ncbi:unnamed protein product [Discula destructiva]